MTDLPNDTTPLEPLIVDFVRSSVDMDRAHPALIEAVDRLARVITTPLDDDDDRPFLTVIVRTQGRRLRALEDSLLCLAAQSDQDFEVVIVGHDMPDAALEELRGDVEAFDPDFRDRVTITSVEGGTRAAPLNRALDLARGHYFAVFDDDDLLFGHWVESFHQAARLAPGVPVRAVVANQRLEPEPWHGGLPGGFRTTSWPLLEFPSTFEALEHLLVNKSPFMSWAFPMTLVRFFGKRFDEELVVCEDWDYILRSTQLLGVVEVPEITSIYRRWEGGAESSYSAHDRAQWAASEARVLDRFRARPLTIPAGELDDVRRQLLLVQALHGYSVLFNGHELRQPLKAGWSVASPTIRFAARVRNRLRRLRGRR